MVVVGVVVVVVWCSRCSNSSSSSKQQHVGPISGPILSKFFPPDFPI